MNDSQQAVGNQTITSIYQFTPEALGELRAWIELAGIAIPISQLRGFTQFAVQSARVAASESTSSSTYTNLATDGPSIPGLPAGKYLFMHGFQCVSTVGGAYASPSVDGATPSDADAAAISSGGPVMYVATGTITNQNGATVKLQYRSVGGSSTFKDRWLIAIRYA